jgi:hypothetical protein
VAKSKTAAKRISENVNKLKPSIEANLKLPLLIGVVKGVPENLTEDSLKDFYFKVLQNIISHFSKRHLRLI